jgi:hypothetical protein
MGLLDDAIREHLDLKRRRGADPAEVERAEREALGPVRRGPEEPAQAEPSAEQPPAYDQQQEPEWQEPFDEPGDRPEPLADESGPGPAVEDDPFAGSAVEHDPFAAQPDAGFVSKPEPYEPDAPPAEPDPLTLEQQPRRRNFLRRKQQPPPAPEPEDYADYLDHDDRFAEPPADADVAPQRTVPPEPNPADLPPPARAQSPAESAGGETVEYEVEAALEAQRGAETDDVLEETPEFLQDTPDHDRLWFEQRPPRDFDFDG